MIEYVTQNNPCPPPASKSPAQMAAAKVTGKALADYFGSGNGNYWANAGGANAKLDDALYNDLDKQTKLKREAPHHRRFLDLQLQGYNVHEIAAITGFSISCITVALRQPWARQHFINASKKTVTEQIKEVLEKEALPSIKLLVKVRDDANARNADRLSASQQLLDRFLGKAAQPIITQEKPAEQLTNDELAARTNAILNGLGNPPGVPSTPAD